MSERDSKAGKLSKLTRSISRRDFASARRLLGEHGHSGVNRASQAIARPVPLKKACPGKTVTVTTPAGKAKYHLIRRTLSDVSPGESAANAEFARVKRGARERFDELQASAEFSHAANAAAGDLLFMDLETCGFSGMPIFLVGLMSFQEGELVFEQLFARNYSEEPAILQEFASRLAAAKVLITFNGKAFDMNMVRERAAFYGIDVSPKDAPGENRMCPHLDLLHESRRRWKGKLPNCRLQTLEQYFCRRRRVGDIPGAAIPDAYHNFVDSGDARQVRDILHHNLLDLLTMAQLLCVMLTSCEPSDDS